MSAFICNDTHVTALAAYAARRRLCVFRDGAVHQYHFDDVAKVGAILHDENCKSVDHRYRETNERDFEVCPWAESRPFTAVEILKAAQCLQYQSCEHPEWETSHAKAILDAIIHTAIGELPGYDKADAWEIRVPAKVIA